jgi:hypothetical protein
MTEPNQHLTEQARANVADRLVQPYQKRAVISGSWDGGQLVQDEIERLLKQPPQGDAE